MKAYSDRVLAELEEVDRVYAPYGIALSSSDLDMSPEEMKQASDAQTSGGELAADFTPVVGDAKAVIEIPEDMSMARDLMEQGYDEGSIIDMGLGAGLASLSLAGTMPIIGDIGGVLKKGVKATAKERLGKEQIQNMAVPGDYYGTTYGKHHQKAADKDRLKAQESLDNFMGPDELAKIDVQGNPELADKILAKNIGNMKGQTAYASDISFEPEEIKDIKGLMQEEVYRDSSPKLDILKKNIAEKGYEPQNIQIVVREDGTPFIFEGNHRLAEALQSNRPEIKADIIYLRDGEKAEGQFSLGEPTVNQQTDKALSTRGRPTTSVEDAEFTGKGKRPTPKVFHGAKSMGESKDADVQRYEKLRRSYNDTYVKDPVQKLFSDKETDMIKSRGMPVDDFIQQQEVGAIQIPVGNVDGELDTVPVIFKRDGDKVSAYAIDTDTMKILDEKEPLASMETYDGEILYDEVQEELIGSSVDLSVTSDMVGEKRIDAIKREGFRPYVADYDLPSDESFVSEMGLAGRTTGEHAELKQKMLSTSRDPLVAMKPNFGGRDTGNVVYADVPEGATRDMTPREYTLVTNSDVSMQDIMDEVPTGRKALPPLAEGQVGYRLPKSIHLEAEEAIVMPENLNVKALKDNPELVAKIQRGQDMVDNIISDVKGMHNIGYGVDDLATPSVQKLAYNKVRDTFKNLQSLGQYTEQYGARGTYDDLLESFLDDEATYPFFKNIIFDMPEQMKKGTEMYNNMTGLREVMLGMKQQRMQGARGKARRQLRNVPDELVRKVVFGGGGSKVTDKERMQLGKAGIQVFFDGDVKLDGLGYNDLKKILLMGTQKFNRGGLASRK